MEMAQHCLNRISELGGGGSCLQAPAAQRSLDSAGLGVLPPWLTVRGRKNLYLNFLSSDSLRIPRSCLCFPFYSPGVPGGNGVAFL